MRGFSASEREVRKAKDLVAKSGVLTFPEAKWGHKLAEETENLVSNSCENYENSRLMPGKKVFISAKKLDGTREQIRKGLIVCDLSELYAKFVKT